MKRKKTGQLRRTSSRAQPPLDKPKNSGHFRQNGERRRENLGQVSGENHPSVKLSVEDVALLRLLAAERSQPRGWIKDYARARKVSGSTLTQAIGGQAWSEMKDPPPVPAKKRWAGPADRHRPMCPRCGRQKYQRKECTAEFHRVDHRAGGRSRRPGRPRRSGVPRS
ncbi:MAG TPA: hypothetical protein VHV78_01270 [Gemmatimonadaceae bacterium]|jgi:hypothetical protein|nr:hypothetical protein [Gemmatimonadaceae bacterium]